MSSNLALAARTCPVVVSAVRLAAWVGENGKALTAGGSLRPGDVPAAASAVGFAVRAKVRRAADVPEVHRPWRVAVAAGLIAVTGNRAVRADVPDDPLAVWWAGLLESLTVEAADNFGADPRITALTTLTVVTEKHIVDEWALDHVSDIMRDRGDWDPFGHPQLHGRSHPVDAILALLREFGVIEGTRLTPLGVWARAELGQVVPPRITPDTAVRDLLELLAGLDEADAWKRATRWFGERTAAEIAAELVRGAAEATPAQRVTAVGLISGLGGEAVAALRAAGKVPNLAAHGRSVAHHHGLAPLPAPADLVWLATEYAHADLVHHGVSAARYTAMDYLHSAGIALDTGGIDRISGSGHPRATEVADALATVAGSPVPVQQLKISLTGSCWRRVLIAEDAPLAFLHHVIIALFGWDDDHLHMFTVGRREYADPFHGLEEMGSEEEIRLYQALPQPKATISHTYDFGASWHHLIELEKVLVGHPLPQPECVGWRGDNPVEYYDPDDPEEAKPFDVEAVNKRLAALLTVEY